jgi:hypothetical protein
LESDPAQAVIAQAPQARQFGRVYRRYQHMGCFSTSKVAVGDGEEKVGIERNRKCRDIFWLILFILFLAGMGAVAFFAVKRGNLQQ